jgi:hypothetical protein
MEEEFSPTVISYSTANAAHHRRGTALVMAACPDARAQTRGVSCAHCSHALVLSHAEAGSTAA